MYSKDQILLEQVYRQTIYKNVNERWEVKNIFLVLEKLQYKCGEKTGTKGDVMVEIRDAKRPHPYVRISSRSNNFQEIIFGESTPGALDSLHRALIDLETKTV